MPGLHVMAHGTALLPRICRQVAAILLPYVSVVVARHLDLVYLTQLERYKSSRLWGWLCRHWGMALDGRAALVQAAVLITGVALARLHFPVVAFYIAWVAAGMWLRAYQRSLQVSQRLQFTPRAARLTAANLILAIAMRVHETLPFQHLN